MLQMQLTPSPITATVDFSAPGVSHGFLRRPSRATRPGLRRRLRRDLQGEVGDRWRANLEDAGVRIIGWGIRVSGCIPIQKADYDGRRPCKGW
ncbi:hypothetical protein [Paracoccus mutanolyticus]|uniref:hypothetical protein n=1 Tax=Paracoccus mutanolyticus TaxID=1499308 RepID=UPI001674B356|nr:hypothetical protein [Paracoccus mutanolyticus]